jgi:hypothetical protein
MQRQQARLQFTHAIRRRRRFKLRRQRLQKHIRLRILDPAEVRAARPRLRAVPPRELIPGNLKALLHQHRIKRALRQPLRQLVRPRHTRHRHLRAQHLPLRRELARRRLHRRVALQHQQ